MPTSFSCLLNELKRFKIKSYCVGQQHYSATKNNVGDIPFNKKSDEELIFVFGQCPIFNRRKSLSFSDNTVIAERLGDFFKNLGKKGLILSKNVEFFYNPGRALDFIANNAKAAASRSPKAASTTITDEKNFHYTGKDYMSEYLPNFFTK